MNDHEAQYSIAGSTVPSSDARLQELLQRVYGVGGPRPRCLCVPHGIEMYVARLQPQFYLLKRMPDTGRLHHPSCPSFEPEPAMSGLSLLIGQAIVEHSPEFIELHLDFPLTRMPGRAIPRGDAHPPTEVTASRRKMSLRALTHYLWQRADFNRWVPGMRGKRSWAVLRRHILEAAQGIRAKGEPLCERLYLPEPFDENQKMDLAKRRRTQLARLHSTCDGRNFNMMVAIGEFKSAESSQYGHRVWIKHMPDCPLLIEDRAWLRTARTFKPLLEAREVASHNALRLVVTALLYANREFIYQIHTLSMMLTTGDWIPVDGLQEISLIEALQARRFVKPLRYDAKSAASYPSALLLDTGPIPTPLHVMSAFADSPQRVAKLEALKTEAGVPWIWHTEETMPDLPKALHRDGTPEKHPCAPSS